MQKIIAIILVVCLLVALTSSASAVDVYSTNLETEPLLKSSAIMSTYDSGISVASVEPSDLDEYLTSSGSYLSNSGTITGGAYSPTSTVADLIRNGFSGLHYNVVDITNTLLSLLRGSGTIPNTVGGTTSGTNVSIWQLITNGFQSLSYVLNSIDGSLDNLKDYSTILQNIYNSVDGVESSLSTINSSLGTVNTSVGTVDTSVNRVNTTLTSLLNYNFIGSGINLLSANGSVSSLSYNAGTDEVLRLGFVGLRSVLTGGVDKSFSYFSTLYDNNNTTTTTQSVGIAPLLNTHLSNIGENLAHLAYVFANDEEIKLREDSQPLLDTTDSFYDDSDSNVKVSINNVGSLKDIAGNFTSIIDADADIGDAFSIVSNSNTYRWFSADTAMNLDSLGVSPADFEESTYDRLHREFNEIYFPDRVGGVG